MTAFVLALLLSVVAGDSTRRIVIDTSNLGRSNAQVLLVDQGTVKVTVTRSGDVRRIRVEKAGPLVLPSGADEYVVEPVDGELRASMVGSAPAGFVVPPSRILVDGVALDAALPQRPEPSPKKKSFGIRYFICPSDETIVRVTAQKETGELRCPLDGTPMREAAGRQKEYFLLQ
jgi:hypothetical protein